jgi:hypothetical protein
MSLPPAARPILERLAFVIYLALLVCSIGVAWLGWLVGHITGHYAALGWGLAGLLGCRWLHVHGHAHWHFAECNAALDTVEASATWPRPEREERLAGEVEGLLSRMEVEPDVWARGELRREIASRLATAPALREEFAERLAEHPEL